ncbi:MAG: Fe-S-containing hydro-lyase [Thermacetogeniaceae bacterium]|jgi:fumarate hydratase subunit beta
MDECMRIKAPFDAETARALQAGQQVLLSGVIFGARDQAHRRFAETLARGQDLPVDLRGQVIYYVGPTPARPGRVIGAAGPTTAGRMDAFTPQLLAYGVRGMIGKGDRSPDVIAAIRQNGAVYLAATGGAGALLSHCIKEAQVVAYHDLGTEALWRFVIEDFPATVAIDSRGRNLYQTGPASYRQLHTYSPVNLFHRGRFSGI